MKTKPTKTLVRAYECPNCHDLVYSRARHDFRRCSCGAIFVDGGFDYVRLGYVHDRAPRLVRKFVKATRDELFADWSSISDKFGIIKGGKK